MEDVKIRIAVLWIFMAVAMSATTVMMSLDPWVIEQITSGEAETSAGTFLFMALLWLGPLTMAFLSVTLKDSINRWANIIAGIVFAGLYIFTLPLAILETQRPVHEILMAISTIVASVLIVWFAWKWPKQET